MTPTKLTVFDGETQLPVFITQAGQFAITRTAADGSEDTVERKSFEDLTKYAENLAKRNDAKARKAKATGVEVSVVRTRYGRGIDVATGRLFGMADGSNRVLQQGFGKDNVVSSYDTVYRPFTAEDVAEYARLCAAERAAEKANRDFLSERELGRARDVATQPVDFARAAR